MRLVFVLFTAINIYCAHAQLVTQTQNEPNYAVVFPQNKVNKLEIKMTPSTWASIHADMKAKYGTAFGKGSGFAPSMEEFDDMPNSNTALMEETTPPMMPFMSDETPDYVPVSVKFGGKKWQQVGFRLKGNSSLMAVWGVGIYKLPFRLKFNAFAKAHPELKKQRFYGFKELSMSPGFADNSLIREKATADIFRMAGIPAAQTAFYEVYIDFGEGQRYCGIYTMVEVIDDTMVKTQFGDDKGNIYKPQSNLKRFVLNQFEKKNNKTTQNYADVQAFVAALNAPQRETNPALWRSNLEQTFDVQHFLKFLSVNNALQNWDTYGRTNHNYYLYNAPTKHLTWIPWDHNMSLGVKMPIPAPPPGFAPPDEPAIKTAKRLLPPRENMGQGMSLSMTEVRSNWPLIRYLADDPLYFAQYKQYLRGFINNIFTQQKMDSLFQAQIKLIAPFVRKEQKPYSNLPHLNDFEAAFNELSQHIQQQRKAAQAFLEKP